MGIDNLEFLIFQKKECPNIIQNDLLFSINFIKNLLSTMPIKNFTLYHTFKEKLDTYHQKEDSIYANKLFILDDLLSEYYEYLPSNQKP